MTEDLKENYSKAKYHSPQKYGNKLAVVFVVLRMLILKKIVHFLVEKGVKLH